MSWTLDIVTFKLPLIKALVKYGHKGISVWGQCLLSKSANFVNQTSTVKLTHSFHYFFFTLFHTYLLSTCFAPGSKWSTGDIMVSKTLKTLLLLSIDSSEGKHHKHKLKIVKSALMEKYRFLWEHKQGHLRILGESCPWGSDVWVEE